MLKSGRALAIAIVSVFLFSRTLLIPGTLLANPSGVISSQGVGSIQGMGTAQVTIQQSAPKGIINWQSFNIAPGEITRFIQPSAQSMILNRIYDANPSQILGSLQANGSVILLNPNGVLFGKGSQINVNGLVTSTLNLTDTNFLSGNYLFQGSGINGLIKNEGSLQSATGGYIYLFAPNIQNNGIIQSPEGQIYLGAGNSVYLSNNPNGSGLLVQVTAPAGTVVNLSQLIANGGQINLYGAAVSQNGLIQAAAVRQKNGKIELYASQNLTLGGGSRTEANGGSGIGQGGSVTAISDKSAGQTSFNPGAVIDISGGQLGGDGGSAEISGHDMIFNGVVTGTALPGYLGGRLLIDPYDVTYTDSTFLNLLTTPIVKIQADHDINITGTSGSPVDLTTNWISQSSLSSLTLWAGHDIHFSNIILQDTTAYGSGSKYTFNATAGNDIVLSSAQIWVGNGGGMSLTAGNDIRLEHTSGGTYSYLWAIDGGDIHLTAGRDLVAPIPFDATLNQYSGIRLGGIGFSTQAVSGNLYIKTGRDFIGGTIDGVKVAPGFTLSNGVADMTVGGHFGTSDGYAKITLGKGTLKVNSTGDIYLGNVQDQGLVEQDQAMIDPGNQVLLTSQRGDIHINPSRDQSLNSNLGDVLMVYPASFSATAFQGNIYFDGGLIQFWPSQTGSLSFTAFNGIKGTISALSNIYPLYPDPNQLINKSSNYLDTNLPSYQRGPNRFLNPYPTVTGGYTPPSILFKTVSGDISHLSFHFLNPINQKVVAIDSGGNLSDFVAEIGVPLKDSTALIRSAGDMIFSSQQKDPSQPGSLSGVSFIGPGTGHIYAGGNLDLASSDGIEDHISKGQSHIDDSNQPGLIDISVGKALLMTESKIWSYNGAGINIHGTGGNNVPVGSKQMDKTDKEGNVIYVRDEKGNITKDQDGNPVTVKEWVSLNVGAQVIPKRDLNKDLGIITLRGGDIQIVASENVNVKLSKVATISGANIQITSINGDISAGYGSPDAQVAFWFDSLDPKSGAIFSTKRYVPGSGIFTFDERDPNPLPAYPSPPDIISFPFLVKNIPLEQEDSLLIKEAFVGHDVSFLSTKYLADVTPVLNAYYQPIKENFRKDWKLGDIYLKAGGSIIIPPAGVRGKRVTIDAPNLNLNGGQLKGDVTLVNVQNISGNDKGQGIQGPVSGTIGGTVVNAAVPIGNGSSSGSLGALTGSTGGVSTQVASTSSSASLPSAKTEQVVSQEATKGEESEAGPSSARSSSAGGKRKGGGKKFVLKQGVIIEVDVKESEESEK